MGHLKQPMHHANTVVIGSVHPPLPLTARLRMSVLMAIVMVVLTSPPSWFRHLRCRGRHEHCLYPARGTTLVAAVAHRAGSRSAVATTLRSLREPRRLSQLSASPRTPCSYSVATAALATYVLLAMRTRAARDLTRVRKVALSSWLKPVASLPRSCSRELRSFAEHCVRRVGLDLAKRVPPPANGAPSRGWDLSTPLRQTRTASRSREA
jgi:hypothetical protein